MSIEESLGSNTFSKLIEEESRLEKIHFEAHQQLESFLQSIANLSYEHKARIIYSEFIRLESEEIDSISDEKEREIQLSYAELLREEYSHIQWAMKQGFEKQTKNENVSTPILWFGKLSELRALFDLLGEAGYINATRIPSVVENHFHRKTKNGIYPIENFRNSARSTSPDHFSLDFFNQLLDVAEEIDISNLDRLKPKQRKQMEEILSNISQLLKQLINYNIREKTEL